MWTMRGGGGYLYTIYKVNVSGLKRINGENPVGRAAAVVSVYTRLMIINLYISTAMSLKVVQCRARVTNVKRNLDYEWQRIFASR